MARLRTWGWEASIAHDFTSPFAGDVDPGSNQTPVTRVSSPVRSGGFACKVDSGAGNLPGNGFIILLSSEQVLGRTYFARVYFRFDNLPGSTVNIMRWCTTPTAFVVSARLTSGGKLQLFNDVSASQIGSDSADTITADASTWYRIELSANIGTGSVDAAELRLGSNVVASATGLSLNDTLMTVFTCGWFDAPGANKVLYMDDGAINDDTGSTQNAWPGEGKVALLKPISDNARTAWVSNGNTTTTLRDGVDNTPPVGIATNTTPDFSYIKHPGGSAGTTDAYDANMTTYTTAGLAATDLITLVQGVINTAEEVTTGAKLLSFECLSNPVISSTGSFDVAPTTGAQGTWPSKWNSKWGPATYGPTPTLGTSPVMRVIRPETATRVASVDFMGLYVEYVSPGKAPPPFQKRWRYLPRRMSV